MKKCSVSDCTRESHARGYCRPHYLRVRRNGDTDPRRGGSEVVRFWRGVDRGAPDECWEWRAKGALYGLFRHLDGFREGAHRASYRINKGPIPAGMLVMHSCDNRRCVNPAHLSLGTPQDNMDDMARKGRRVAGALRGTDCSFSRLDPEAVRYIRANPDASLKSLGERFGVEPNTVRAVRIGKTWRHVT